jgi:superfamily II DNA/RNA helicase
MRQRLARKLEAETTAWALDGDEDADEVVLAESGIPNESELVRELIRMVPDGTDRKFDTLVRAIEQVRAGNTNERFIVFTQYRETLEFLREEIGRLYGPEKIVTIKGGPLDDKIAAVEKFWEPGGAQFLISTSAGGEGINLQVCRILFNYDLPWNPMAVEQRIGRIHRYGQQDTVQVYNLVAEDTVEQQIYDLLEQKLQDIARTIGKIDPVTGETTEDFRGDILGNLGSAPNYQELYRRALIDRDYRRTATELEQMMQTALRASEALQSLTQDMRAYNLEHYRRLQGELTLNELRTFVERAVLRLGGAFIPNGDSVRIETPQSLMSYRNVAARYDAACFVREVAMRRKGADLMGIGHPLVDAIVDYFSSAAWRGDVTALRSEDEKRWSARYVVEAFLDDGQKRIRYESVVITNDGSWRVGGPKEDLDGLKGLSASGPVGHADVGNLRSRITAAMTDAEARMRAEHQSLASIRSRLVGLAR